MSKLIPILAVMFSASAFANTAEGEYIARIADCVACHTQENGDEMAGGKRFQTPLGDIFSTNITPDRQQGIGAYSYEEFDRAVRQGIARDGHYLYPAMPYPSYAKMKEEDIRSLYDYFMHGVKPSAQKNRASEIPWYFSPRWPLRIWNGLFTETAAGTAVAQDPQQNRIMRGKYIVEGPGHCGACHTPRGIAQQEKAYDSADPVYLSGAMIDGWFAPSLRDLTLADDELQALLHRGRSRHAAVAGPMSEVITQSTQYLTEADRRSVSAYLLSLNSDKAHGDRVVSSERAKTKNASGNALYFRYCSTCHAIDGKGTDYNVPSLVNNAAVNAEDPANLIKVIAWGAETPVTKGNIPYKMPAYQGEISDEQLRDVVNYVRGEWGNHVEPISEQKIKDVLENKH